MGVPTRGLSLNHPNPWMPRQVHTWDSQDPFSFGSFGTHHLLTALLVRVTRHRPQHLCHCTVQGDEEVDSPSLQANSRLTQRRLTQQYSTTPKGPPRRHSTHVPVTAAAGPNALAPPAARTTNAFGPPAARTR